MVLLRRADFGPAAVLLTEYRSLKQATAGWPGTANRPRPAGTRIGRERHLSAADGLVGA